MPFIRFTNNAIVTLPLALADTDLVINLVPGDGALFSSPAPFEKQVATLIEGSAIEVVHITNRASDALTITRAQEGTVAQSFTSAAKLFAGTTAGVLSEIISAIETNVDEIILLDDYTDDLQDEIDDNASDIAVLQASGLDPVLVGTAPPSTTPVNLHQWFFDSDTKGIWRANGTSTPGNWDQYHTSKRYTRVNSGSLFLGNEVPLGRIHYDTAAQVASLKVNNSADNYDYIRLANTFHGNSLAKDLGFFGDDGSVYTIDMLGKHVLYACETGSTTADNLIFKARTMITGDAVGCTAVRVIIKNNGVLPNFKYQKQSGAISPALTVGISGTPPASGEKGVLEFMTFGETPTKIAMNWITLVS